MAAKGREEAALRESKLKWLECHTLLTELREMLTDAEISDHNNSSTDRTLVDVYRMAQTCLAHAEGGDYVDCDPDLKRKAKLLGLSREDVLKANPHAKDLEKLQKYLIPALEARLHAKCQRLLKMMPTTEVAASGSLVEVIREQQRQLEEEKLALQREKTEYDDKLKNYHKLLHSSVSSMSTILSQYRLRRQPDVDDVTTTYLARKCEALCMKIRLLELQILVDTYTEKTVKALKIIRRELDQKTSRVEGEMEQSSRALAAYERAGPELETLVTQYTDLQRELDSRAWALRELQTSDK